MYLTELEPNLQSVTEHPAKPILGQENHVDLQAHKYKNKCLLLEGSEFGGWFRSIIMAIADEYTGPELELERAKSGDLEDPGFLCFFPCGRGID